MGGALAEHWRTSRPPSRVLPQQAGEADGQPAAPPLTASAYAQPISADLRQCPHMALADPARCSPSQVLPQPLAAQLAQYPCPLFLELFLR